MTTKKNKVKITKTTSNVVSPTVKIEQFTPLSFTVKNIHSDYKKVTANIFDWENKNQGVQITFMGDRDISYIKKQIQDGKLQFLSPAFRITSKCDKTLKSNVILSSYITKDSNYSVKQSYAHNPYDSMSAYQFSSTTSECINLENKAKDILNGIDPDFTLQIYPEQEATITIHYCRPTMGFKLVK